jgi:hypothetical protein
MKHRPPAYKVLVGRATAHHLGCTELARSGLETKPMLDLHGQINGAKP